jgi:MFS family permease
MTDTLEDREATQAAANVRSGPMGIGRHVTRRADPRRSPALVASWGACLLPFAFAPVGATIACFAIGGLIYGPFIPLTSALFQSATSTTNLPGVLAARGAVMIISTPLGTALGGPLVGAIGAANTLTASGVATVLLAASGVATVLLAAGAAPMWPRSRRRDQPNGR